MNQFRLSIFFLLQFFTDADDSHNTHETGCDKYAMFLLPIGIERGMDTTPFHGDSNGCNDFAVDVVISY